MTPKAVVLIVGGTEIEDTELQTRLVQLFRRGLAYAAVQDEILIIAENTQDQATAALGKALLERSEKALLLGIVNEKQITVPEQDEVDDSDNEQNMAKFNCTHLILLKDTTSESEVDILHKLAEEFSQDVPVLMILVNESPMAKDEVLRCVRQGWPILVIEGSGGLADKIQQEFQVKKNYIRKLSELRSHNTVQPEPPPPFISDLVLTEIIDEGNLHFFPITAMPEKLELSIGLMLEEKNILNQAQAQQRIYSKEADRQEKMFLQLQNSILLLGVLIIALAAIETFYTQMMSGILLSFSIGGFKTNVLFILLVVMTLLFTLLIAGTNRFNPRDKWVTLQTASGAINREMFHYRTHTNIYSDVQIFLNRTTRETTLSRMLEAITRQFVEGSLDYKLFPDPSKSKKSSRKQAGSASANTKQRLSANNLSTYLPPNRYIAERVEDQIAFYKDRSARLARRLTLWQWIILVMGAVSTLLAALQLQITITVTTAVVIAAVAYLEYTQLSNRLRQYNYAILALTNIHNWWLALDTAQADQDNIDKLVDHVETSLQNERAGRVQQMQTALTELREQQFKQEGAFSANERIRSSATDETSLKE